MALVSEPMGSRTQRHQHPAGGREATHDRPSREGIPTNDSPIVCIECSPLPFAYINGPTDQLVCRYKRPDHRLHTVASMERLLQPVIFVALLNSANMRPWRTFCNLWSIHTGCPRTHSKLIGQPQPKYCRGR